MHSLVDRCLLSSAGALSSSNSLSSALALLIIADASSIGTQSKPRDQESPLSARAPNLRCTYFATDVTILVGALKTLASIAQLHTEEVCKYLSESVVVQRAIAESRSNTHEVDAEQSLGIEIIPAEGSSDSSISVSRVIVTILFIFQTQLVYFGTHVMDSQSKSNYSKKSEFRANQTKVFDDTAIMGVGDNTLDEASEKLEYESGDQKSADFGILGDAPDHVDEQQCACQLICEALAILHVLAKSHYTLFREHWMLLLPFLLRMAKSPANEIRVRCVVISFFSRFSFLLSFLFYFVSYLCVSYFVLILFLILFRIL
jgi:hypothetical protein